MFLNAIRLSLREIRRNLLRSFLTVLGIVIGVAAVITMVTLGNGATRLVGEKISTLGTNMLILLPGKDGMVEAPKFRMSDVEAIAEQIPSLLAVSPEVQTNAKLVVGAENLENRVLGVTNAYFIAANWTLADGRLFSEDDEKLGRAVCVIGDTVRSKLFGESNPVGRSIRIKKFYCEVIGLFAGKGQMMGVDQDAVVFAPVRAVQRRLTGNSSVPVILISTKDGANTDRAMKQIKSLMRERRRLSDNDEDNFDLLNTKQMTQVLTGTVDIITTLLGIVAAVSLLVGGIGIMNIMLVSVTERTREIGIRLAIGALGKEVLAQFLTEAVALSATGGLIGIVLAFMACAILSFITEMPFIFSPGIIFVSFVFSVGIGIIFGYMPARRAASLDPIEALRHE
ncbi:MAG: ABC transporter permease [Azoarcus sp.]|jgi:putative ABC transport system permease protein|nr:ABC transporter permease [Azoarcus sp.]